MFLVITESKYKHLKRSNKSFAEGSVVGFSCKAYLLSVFSLYFRTSLKRFRVFPDFLYLFVNSSFLYLGKK